LVYELRSEAACDLTLRRKEKGLRRVHLSVAVDEGGAADVTSRWGRSGGPLGMLARVTLEPMSSKEAVTMALNSAILSAAS